MSTPRETLHALATAAADAHSVLDALAAGTMEGDAVRQFGVWRDASNAYLDVVDDPRVVRDLCADLAHSESDRARLAAEVETWRWLHWSHPESQWACACGAALGYRVLKCDECGATKPTKPAARTQGET